MNTGLYDRIVFDFLDKTEHVLLVASEDPVFIKVLRAAINKTVGVKRDCLYIVPEPPTASKGIRDYTDRKTPTILFLARMLRGRPTTEFIANVKNLFQDQKIIVLVSETRKENIAYFYELGVNNVIEKLAFTIKPQGKLSELMDLGKGFLAKGDHKQVLKVAEKILALKPGSPARLMLRGDAYLEMGRREDAVAAYLEAHESSRLYLEPLKRLANVFKGHNQERYLEYLKKFDKLSPLHTERKCEIGKVHVDKGEINLAEKYFDQAIVAATQEAMNVIGVIAENIADAVGETSPELSEKYLAKMLESKGDRLSREDLVHFNRLGMALRRQGKWQEAIANYEKALTVAPDDEGLYYNIVWPRTTGARSAKPCAPCTRPWRSTPASTRTAPMWPSRSAPSSSENGNAREAAGYLKAALQVNPEHAEAKALLERCRKRSR